MTLAGALSFIILSINPIGGALISIPLAIFELKYSPWLTWAAAFPLAYVQVPVVDLCWDTLCRWHFFRTQLEKKRSVLVEKLLSSEGAFWPTLLISPLIGPWLVMALMRYARVPQRKIALPIILGLAAWCAVLTAACVFAARTASK